MVYTNLCAVEARAVPVGGASGSPELIDGTGTQRTNGDVEDSAATVRQESMKGTRTHAQPFQTDETNEEAHEHSKIWYDDCRPTRGR